MKEKFDVIGMTCSVCSSHVEKSVNKLAGVRFANVNLLSNSMMVDYDDSVGQEDIMKAVREAGYTASPVLEKEKNDDFGGSNQNKTNVQDEERRALKVRIIASLIFLIPLLYISMGHMLGLPIPQFFTGAQNAVSYGLTQMLLSVSVVYINRSFFINGVKTLIKGAPNMDTLVALGASAAFFYGVYVIYKMGIALGESDFGAAHHMTMDLYFESAATILTLITLGKYLEAGSKDRTSDAIKKLMDLTPKIGTRIRDGEEESVPVEAIAQGDLLAVKSGEVIPVDGIVEKGEAFADESAVTGESIPVRKVEGDNVVAGTVNKSGYIQMRAERVGEDTTVAEIIRLVEAANTSKAPIARLADKVSGVFVPVVMAVALVTGAVWFIAGQSFDFALTMFISVLVISCPCALGLATPTAIMVGTGKGAEEGILFKTAESLETIHKIDVMILDKTGTVTAGKLKVTDIDTYNVSENELVGVTATAEALSEHPLGLAVLEYANRLGVWPAEANRYKSFEGMGIEVISENKTITVGNGKMMEERGIDTEVLKEFINKASVYSNQGKTPLWVAVDQNFMGMIALADTVLPSSPEAVKAFENMGIEVIMITGDNEKTAKAVAEHVGIKKVVAGVLPAGKEEEVRKLREKGKRVAMVGDGINDAPALAKADMGIAIGAGTDIAIDSADIVLMKSDLSDAITAIELSKAVIRNIKQNLFWAFIYNVIGIPLAAGVLYPVLGLTLSPMFAAVAMSLSSFCVVTNALRLRFFKGNR